MKNKYVMSVDTFERLIDEYWEDQDSLIDSDTNDLIFKEKESALAKEPYIETAISMGLI